MISYGTDDPNAIPVPFGIDPRKVRPTPASLAAAVPLAGMVPTPQPQPPQRAQGTTGANGAQEAPIEQRYRDWQAQEPKQPDLTPAKPTLRQRIFAGMAAYKSPEMGMEMLRQDEQGPAEQREKQYQQAESAWERQGQALGQEANISDLALRQRLTNAEIDRDEAAAKAKPERWATVTSGGQSYQWNPQTNRYDIPVGSPKAKEPNEQEQAVSDWMAANKLPDTPANRTKARAALKAQDREPPSDQLVEDRNGNYEWVNPRTHKITPASSVQPRGTAQQANAKLQAAQQKATAAIGSLNQQLAQGKIAEPAYIDQSIAEWKTVAQAAKQAGQPAHASDDLIALYAKKYGGDAAKIHAALSQDGWE